MMLKVPVLIVNALTAGSLLLLFPPDPMWFISQEGSVVVELKYVVLEYTEK